MQGDPRYFSPRRMAAMQSDVPSQQCPAGIPYYPALAVSVMHMSPHFMVAQAQAALQIAQDNEKAANIPSYTRYVYDSRPPQGIDFFAPINDGTQTATQLFPGTFLVPAGYIAIVRSFSFTNSPGFTVFSSAGNPTTSSRITLLKNRNPISGFTNINVGSWGIATVTIPCFIMLSPGDVIAGQWNGGLTLPEFGTGFTFYGQLLLDDQRNLPLQSGNAGPEPVVETTGDAWGGAAPAAGGAGGGMTTQDQVLQFNAPEYPGPFPPSIGVNIYLANRDRFRGRVRQQYLDFKAAHPSALINVTGNSGDALVPYDGVG